VHAQRTEPSAVYQQQRALATLVGQMAAMVARESRHLCRQARRDANPTASPDLLASLTDLQVVFQGLVRTAQAVQQERRRLADQV
jgi:hypothetical protein